MNVTIGDYVLSKEQSRTIIDNPKISMIIAGAGSGKTLTIVGKIKYMLDNNLIKPNEVCVITYTNKAVESLKEKINQLVNVNIDVYTFHKLSLKIIDNSNYEYEIASDELLDKIIDEFFYTKAFGNNTLLDYIYNYFNIYIFKTNNQYNKILNSKNYLKFKKLIKSFILYMNANNLFNNWQLLLKNKKYRKELLIIYAIYLIYENELSSSCLLDFDKMINCANELIVNGIVKLQYKLIIIDEFQDTSYLRFNLIKNIVNKNNSYLCVVGDDYQSIYSFQGCDLNVFLNFKKEFSNVKTYYLNQTFRNSQELINVAGLFINKNKSQINKMLVSNKHLLNPIKYIYYMNNKTILLKIINTISIDKEILILSRNNNDINYYLNDYTIDDNNLYIANDNHKIKYMTVHSSKGLESDVVIVLNMKNDTYGFPNQIKEDNILELLKTRNNIEEERRLFYVALTRTKSYVYLLIPIFNQSLFIKDIKNSVK